MEEARVYHLDSTDPWTNLAVEEHLFLGLGPNDQALILWHNQPCVVIGRHQNPWAECNLVAMKTDNVVLVRRISGGGAVYHDLGNTNFTFMAGPHHYDLDLHFSVVIEALTGLGLQVARNHRNDLIFGSAKISGSAFRHTRQASLHHGTILIDADTTRLAKYLSSDHPVSSSKGISSVRANVVTLSSAMPGLRRETVWEAITNAYRAKVGKGVTMVLGARFAAADEEIQERIAELRGWEWRFGKTPRFTRRVTTSVGEVELEIYHGRVAAVRPAVESRAGVEGSLAAILHDVRYAPDELREHASRHPNFRDEIMRIVEGLS